METRSPAAVKMSAELWDRLARIAATQSRRTRPDWFAKPPERGSAKMERGSRVTPDWDAVDGHDWKPGAVDGPAPLGDSVPGMRDRLGRTEGGIVTLEHVTANMSGHLACRASSNSIPGRKEIPMAIRTVYALTLVSVLLVVPTAPVAGQVTAQVAGPGSNEAVKKRALWTGCSGLSLAIDVQSDTDLAEESVWNAAEVALRSTRVYYQAPDADEAGLVDYGGGVVVRSRSRFVFKVSVFGVGSAHYLETALLSTEVRDNDDGVTTVMTYRTASVVRGNAPAASLLAKVREQMDTVLVDYLRANADCAEGFR